VHILVAFAGLGTGALALLAKKGGRIHRMSGKLFAIAMMVVTLSALVIAWHREKLFLFALGILTLYLVFSGIRALKHKRPDEVKSGLIFDWMFAIICLITSFVIDYLGIKAYKEGMAQLSYITFVFAFICLAAPLFDLYKFTNTAKIYPNVPQIWLYDHLSKMCGAYISALTAPIIVQFHELPLAIQWLWPTLILIGWLIIFIYINSIRRKIKAGIKLSEIISFK